MDLHRKSLQCDALHDSIVHAQKRIYGLEISRWLVSVYRNWILKSIRRKAFCSARRNDYNILSLCEFVLTSPLHKRFLPCCSKDDFFRLLETIRDPWDNYGTLLHSAASSNSAEFIHQFLLHLAQLPSTNSPFETIDSLGCTILHRAVRDNPIMIDKDASVSLVRFLSTLGPKAVLMLDRSGMTCLNHVKNKEFANFASLNGDINDDINDDQMAIPHPSARLKPKAPVLQTDCTPASGNALQACVAAMFNLPLQHVPNFTTDSRGYMAALTEWCFFKGWKISRQESYSTGSIAPLPAAGSICIIRGKSPRGDFGHVVVGQVRDHQLDDGGAAGEGDWYEILMDPHPDGTGIHGSPGWVALFSRCREDLSDMQESCNGLFVAPSLARLYLEAVVEVFIDHPILGYESPLMHAADEPAIVAITSHDSETRRRMEHYKIRKARVMQEIQQPLAIAPSTLSTCDHRVMSDKQRAYEDTLRESLLARIRADPVSAFVHGLN